MPTFGIPSTEIVANRLLVSASILLWRIKLEHAALALG